MAADTATARTASHVSRSLTVREPSWVHEPARNRSLGSFEGTGRRDTASVSPARPVRPEGEASLFGSFWSISGRLAPPASTGVASQYYNFLDSVDEKHEVAYNQNRPWIMKRASRGRATPGPYSSQLPYSLPSP